MFALCALRSVSTSSDEPVGVGPSSGGAAPVGVYFGFPTSGKPATALLNYRLQS